MIPGDTPGVLNRDVSRLGSRARWESERESMKVIATWRAAGMLCALGLGGAAMAQGPALDRVPAGTPLMVAVPSLEKLKAGVDLIQKTFGLDPDAGPLAEMHVNELMAFEGLNTKGAAAIAILAGEDGQVDFEDEPPVVIILPVTNYGAFVQAAGGDGTEPITEIDPMDAGQAAYAKDLRDGYAAVSHDRALLEGFKGASGNGPAHLKLVGSNGRSVLESSLVTVIADLQALAPQIQEGFGSFKKSIQGIAEMGGQDMGANLAMVDALGEALTKDGQAGVIGFNASEKGMTLNLGAQFKEGSETAGYFNSKGKAEDLLNRVPNQPFLFALALDSTPGGVKQLFKNVMNRFAQADPDGAAAMGLTGAMLKTIDTLDGTAFLMGMSPALMGGGLFANTSAYVRTKDPKAYGEALQQAMNSANGKTVQGFTYQTAYVPDAKTVNGVSVAEWSMRMQADPNDPNAQQAMMAMGMIFGMEGGPSGYYAPADGGAVMTYSKNTQLLEQALDAAKGNGLASSQQIKDVAAELPAGRTVEGYVGVKSILDMFMGFAAMMGGGPPEVQIPEDLAPIGLGGTTAEGGLRFVVFAPTQVLTTFKALGDELGGVGGDVEEGAGQPRF